MHALACGRGLTKQLSIQVLPARVVSPNLPANKAGLSPKSFYVLCGKSKIHDLLSTCPNVMQFYRYIESNIDPMHKWLTF